MKRNLSKKLTVSLLIMVLMMAMFAMPAMAAARTFDFITPDDLTVVTTTNGSNFDITVQGYIYGTGYVSLSAEEKAEMDWSIDDTNVIDIDSGGDGSDTANIDVIGEGDATITMTYTQPDDSTISVTTYVVVETNAVVNQVDDIDVTVDFTASAVDEDSNPISDIDDTYDVPLFDLNDTFDTTGEFEDVLQNTPTATHALLYALEIENSSETTSTNINSFDWDWVRANVTYDNEGAYISGIGSDDEYTSGYDFYGWQYELNSTDPGHAASVTPLDDDDAVDWFFDIYTW